MINDKKKADHQQALLRVSSLYKSFGSNQVLKGINMALHERENLAIIGKSGCGKSVLIKCIVGLIKADSGSIQIFNEYVGKQSQKSLDKLRAGIGFLFQSSALYDSMTVRENLAFPLRRHHKGKTKKEVDERVKEALENVHLLETIDSMPSELSGGMRKRIGIARTLILRPKIILYDEPTGGLDPVTAGDINRLMLEVREKYNTASLIISHDMRCIKTTADRIVVLNDGINYAEGTYGRLASSTDPLVKAFFV